MRIYGVNGKVYVQDATNGRIYTLSPTTYQDLGSNFTVTLQTSRSNFGSANRKFEPQLDIIGDTTTGSLAVSWSDNDFTSFSTARNIDMTRAEKRLRTLGS